MSRRGPVLAAVLLASGLLGAGRLLVRDESSPPGAPMALRHARVPAAAPESAGTNAASVAAWRLAKARAPGPERDAELGRLLDEMAAIDLATAEALALSVAEEPLHGQLLARVFGRWAELDPSSAVRRALALSGQDRVAAAAAILQVSACVPEQALQTTREFCEADPDSVNDYGVSLVTALVHAGHCEIAVGFAAQEPVSGDGEVRQKWVQRAFELWAERAPEAAVLASLDLPEDGLRFEALQATVAGWVKRDPEGAAEFIAEIPVGPDRANTMAEALRLWVRTDPKAASEWLERRPARGEHDAGVVALATWAPLVEQRPAVAVEWGESILDPAQRSNALVAILRQWARTDAASARSYVEKSAGQLLAEDRALLLKQLPTE